MQTIANTLSGNSKSRKRGDVLIGIRLGDRFFSNRNLREVITHCREEYSLMHVAFLDLPEVSSLLAAGLTLHSAVQKTSSEANRIADLCDSMAEESELAGRVKVVRWHALLKNPPFQSALEEMRKLYHRDALFRADIRQAARQELTEALRSLPSEESVDIAVQPLLDHCALFIRASEILGVDRALTYLSPRHYRYLERLAVDEYDIDCITETKFSIFEGGEVPPRKSSNSPSVEMILQAVPLFS